MQGILESYVASIFSWAFLHTRFKFILWQLLLTDFAASPDVCLFCLHVFVCMFCFFSPPLGVASERPTFISRFFSERGKERIFPKEDVQGELFFIVV